MKDLVASLRGQPIWRSIEQLGGRHQALGSMGPLGCLHGGLCLTCG
jgi:hypothetical protein